MSDTSTGTDTSADLNTLDRWRGELEARHPGWRIWYVPTVHRGIIWCAHPRPELNRGSRASLDEAITAVERGGHVAATSDDGA